MEDQIYRGAAIDTRPEDEKAQDYQSIEVASAAPVAWQEKPQSEWRKFPVRDQDGSSTCVAQTGAKILGVENTLEEPNVPFIVFSAKSIYARRQNRLNPGMWGTDALNIMCDYGAALDSRVPSQRLSEDQINLPFNLSQEDIDTAKKYRGGGYVQLPIDIDAIADVIVNKKKPVMLFIYAQFDEWLDVPVIKNASLTAENAPIRHSITGVDAFLWKGEKAILIEDSWGKFYGFEGQRVLTESFLKKRGYFCGYVLDLSNQPVQPTPLPVPPVPQPFPVKPKFHFAKPLTFGMMHDADVKQLQTMLRFEGLFPQKIDITGNYLQITAKAVKAWQMKHGIMDFANQPDVRKVRFGAKSISIANQLYK